MSELEDDGVQAITLEEQIRVVALCRSIAKSNSDILKNEREKWEEENKEQIELVANTKADVEEAEDELRDLTLKAYKETGNKAPAEGVGIREVTKLDYDPKVALDWATEYKMALKLDTTAFGKIVKASPLDFVKITTEPMATIATNLDEAR